MALHTFRLPDPGEGLVEADIVTWRVAVGDQVKINDILVEVETSKSLVELPTPYAGTVTELLVSEGDTVDVGTPIISIDDGPKTNLMFGESVTMEVKPGPHQLRANNTLIWKKVPFEAGPGESLEFAIANRASKLALGMLTLVGVAPMYMTIERKTPAPTH